MPIVCVDTIIGSDLTRGKVAAWSFQLTLSQLVLGEAYRARPGRSSEVDQDSRSGIGSWADPPGLALSFVLAATVGCAGGADTPSPDSARQAFQRIISGPAAERLGVTDFQKTDGRTGEVFGTRIYVMDFSASIDVKDDALVSFADQKITVNDPGPTLANGSFSWDAWFNSTVGGRQMVFKGDEIVVGGEASYLRKESGWVQDGVKHTSHTVDSRNRAAGHSPEALQRQREEAEARARQQAEEQARVAAQVQQLIASARAQLESAQYQAALDSCLRALKDAPANAEALRLRDQIEKTMDVLGIRR